MVAAHFVLAAEGVIAVGARGVLSACPLGAGGSWLDDQHAAQSRCAPDPFEKEATLSSALPGSRGATRLPAPRLPESSTG
jgi:hypothetical protein